jgi:hypothetical protein
MNYFFPVFFLACFLFPVLFFVGYLKKHKRIKTALKTDRILASLNLAPISNSKSAAFCFVGNHQSIIIPTAYQFINSIFTTDKSQFSKKINLTKNNFSQLQKSKSTQFHIKFFIEKKFLITTN